MARNTWSGLTSEAQNKKWSEWEDEYVPSTGEADTIGGEIIRAMDRLIYRFYNDGDMAGEGYGNITCNSSDRYLSELLPQTVYQSLDDNLLENEYESRLKLNHRRVYKFLRTEGEGYFDVVNFKDSREASQEDIRRDRENYDEEEEW